MTFRSLRIESARVSAVALLPTIVVTPGKPDHSLGGVIERRAAIRFWTIEIAFAWGGAWARCGACGRAVNDQTAIRFAQLTKHVRCRPCSDRDEADELDSPVRATPFDIGTYLTTDDGDA